MNWREFQGLQKVAEIGDRFVSYVDEGDGPAVILLHGIPTWGFLWQSILPQLKRTHRVLIPDLLGFGYSDKRDCFDRSIAAQADALSVWLDQLDLQKVSLVAHDIGGGVALRMAIAAPDRFERLGLMNTVCYDSWPIEAMLQFGHPGAARTFSAGTANMLLRQALKQGCAQTPDNDVLDGLLMPYSTEVGKLSLVRNAAALNTNLTTELTSQLPKLQIPTRILWGEDDKFQLLRYGERLAWDLPRADLVRIARARHFVMLDQPHQVTRHLVEFLGSKETVHAGGD